MPAVFDPEFRRRLEVLRRIVARALAGRGGAGRSPLQERGGRVEFASHRPYTPGDEVGAIDWHAYARLETYVVKEFEAPREAELLLLLDRSPSMRLFGKEEAALRLAAALGWLGLLAGARVACASCEGASRWMATPERLPELLEVLEKLPTGGAADLPGALARAPAGGSGRKTVLLLSDFYEAEPFSRTLALLSGRGATVLCAQIIAPEEMRAPEEAALSLRDAETGEQIELALDESTRRRFAARAAAFLAERQALATRNGARLSRVDPAEDLVGAVEHLLLGRRGA